MSDLASFNAALGGAAPGQGSSSDLDAFNAAMGYPTRKRPRSAPAKSEDVAQGAPLLDMPQRMQDAVWADAQRNGLGRNFTVNGMAPDATSAPIAAPAAPTGPIRAGASAIPGNEGLAPNGAPATAAPQPEPTWWQKIRAAGEAGVNTVAGTVGGGLGLAYGALEAAGNNATGTPMDVQQQAMLRARQFTPELPAAVQTPLGREYTANVGDALATHGPSIIGLGPEIAAVGNALRQGAPAAARSMAAMKQDFAAKGGAAPPRVEPSAAPAANAANAAPTFAESAPSVPPGQTLPLAEQARRKAVLRSVGLDQAREGAITGNAKESATDAQMAKVNSPSGNVMQAQLDNEKAALASHADDLVKATGGTQGLDQSTLFGRGNTIVAPLDALKEHFDAQTAALYQAADERAQGVPAPMSQTHAYIGGDQAEFLGTTEGEQLLKGIQARMKSLGMADADGNPATATVQQAEQLKQYLNNQWQPRTARLIRGMKDAIDDDVTSAAGEDIYQQARQMRAQRAATLDNPNGIAKVMDSSGPDGINRSVPIEKIPDAIAGMPVQQFSHVIDTLKNVPDEIQPQGAAALAEIKAHFANKVQAIGTSQAGQWNAKGVTKFLNNNRERMTQVFNPEEMAQFSNLNDAGHILAKDQSYPGAAVQQHNLVQAGIVTGLSGVGGAAGGFLTGGPVGAAAGTWLGAKAGSAINDAASLRAASKRFVDLRDVKP
jgi:hypothetical protein